MDDVTLATNESALDGKGPEAETALEFEARHFGLIQAEQTSTFPIQLQLCPHIGGSSESSSAIGW